MVGMQAFGETFIRRLILFDEHRSRLHLRRAVNSGNRCMKPTTLFKPLVLAALLASTFTAQAAIAVFETQAAFAAATSLRGVDNFDNFPFDTISTGPLQRTAGAYGYTGTAAEGFFGGGQTSNLWLTTASYLDSITFDNFSNGVQAVGGNFSLRGIDGKPRNGFVNVTAVDSSGATYFSVFDANSTSFIGFVSNVSMTSISVFALQDFSIDPDFEPGPDTYTWPTVDNLTLAQGAVAAIPEPETYALMMTGLGVMAFVARRRRA